MVGVCASECVCGGRGGVWAVPTGVYMQILVAMCGKKHSSASRVLSTKVMEDRHTGTSTTDRELER